MIKVIRHGLKVFKATCPVCGCEFEYEYEDLKKEYGFTKIVNCPDCGETIYHKEYREQPIQTPVAPKITEPWDPITKPYITWASSGCEECPNNAFKDKFVVGDTPCTWCYKNTPYCATYNNFEKTVTTLNNLDAGTATSTYVMSEDKQND